MDKILIIDGLFVTHRANISGKKFSHFICSNAEPTEQCSEHLKENIHCECGASWDENENNCFGELYGCF